MIFRISAVAIVAFSIVTSSAQAQVRSLMKMPDPRGEFVQPDWVPRSKQAEIGSTFTRIAKPTLRCMFEPLT